MNKLIIFGVGAIMFAVTSCSNDETVEVPRGNAIGFKTMIDKNASRGAVELTVANLTQFKVWGYAADGLIFDGQVVNAATGTCTYSPLQYWEANKAYAFTAVGSDAASCTAQYTVEAPAVDGKEGFGTIAFDNAAVLGAEDLVWAAKNVAAAAEITADMPVVDLAFKHALSRVKFTFVNGMTEAYKLTITNVRIDNSVKSGTMALPDAAWTLGADRDVLAFDAPAPVDIALGASAVTAYQYIIPGAQALTLSFDVTVDVNGVETPYSHSGVALVLPENLAAYENGMSYNFKAVLTAQNIDPENELQPIVFSATVDPWGADNDIDVTVEKPEAGA